jgi:hypothetical protein
MIGIGLRLLGVFGKIKRGIAWIFGSPKRIAVAAAILLALFGAWQVRKLHNDRNDWRVAAKNYESAYRSWQAAFHKLVVDVELGRIEAARLDKENADRVANELAAIKERTANDYEVALTDTRRAANSLRDKLTKVAARSEGGSGEETVPGAYTARCQTFGYPDCDALLTALPGLLEAAEENTDKLIALQAWVNSVLAVDMNGADQ